MPVFEGASASLAHSSGDGVGLEEVGAAKTTSAAASTAMAERALVKRMLAT